MSDEGSDLQAQITALQGQVAALEGQVSALQAQLAAMQAQTAGGGTEDDDAEIAFPVGGPGP